MDQKKQSQETAPTDEPAMESDDATRRAAAERLAALLALTPIAALLFDPTRAEAGGDADSLV
jgi:hypothetical protein